MNPTESTTHVPAVVLDTNAVLDWLVFVDPGMTAWGEAIEADRVRWIGSARMREELRRALSYPSLSKWKPDSERTLSTFDRWLTLCPSPVPTRSGSLLCSDPDDQVFIDLAVAEQARWLVSHDRALHKLARQAAHLGVAVVRPNDGAP